MMVVSKSGTTEASQRDYLHHRFSLGVAIARELVNCFIGRLSGLEAPPMPANLNYPSWGCLWQRMMFGGVITEFEDPEHIFTNTSGGAYHPGDAWVIDGTHTARRIPDKDMQAAMYAYGTTMGS